MMVPCFEGRGAASKLSSYRLPAAVYSCNVSTYQVLFTLVGTLSGYWRESEADTALVLEYRLTNPRVMVIRESFDTEEAKPSSPFETTTHPSTQPHSL